MKRGKWGFRFDGHTQLSWLTPWFVLTLSDGGKDFNTLSYWSGFEVAWSPDWNAPMYAVVFKQSHRWEFSRLPARGGNFA